jgi:hypothetical protein
VHKVSSALLCIGLALLPLYLGASGGVQVAHALLAVFGFGYIARNGFKPSQTDIALLLLFCFICAREGFDLASLKPHASLMPALYVLFAALTANVMRRVGSEPSYRFPISFGVFAAAAIALIGVIAVGSGAGSNPAERSVGTFNNPNQLGYFSVCIVCIAFLLRATGSISLKVLVTLCVMGALLSIASLSKSAMVSVGGTLLMIGYFSTKSRYAWLIGSVLALLVVAALVYAYNNGYLDSFAAVKRLQDIGADSDDSAEARGYFLLANASLLQLIFGLGTAGVFAQGNNEVHSTIFSMIATYGVIGGFLFLAAVVGWCVAVNRRFGIRGLLAVCFPVLLYGLAHNGSRFAVFWVLFGMSYSTGSWFKNRSRQPISGDEQWLRTVS